MAGDGLRVIGAGFGRTGTFSLKAALERLGFGPCYHMVELLTHRTHIDHWARAQRRGSADWDALFAGYASGVDFPVCSYVERLAEAYPTAKVVLSTRDEDAWYDSASATILRVRPTAGQTARLMLKLPISRSARQLWRIGLHNQRLLAPLRRGEEEAKRIYREHNQRVREVVPPDRLLEFSVKEGWAPLCKFLGVDVPDEPFPRVNERDGFEALVRGKFDA